MINLEYLKCILNCSSKSVILNNDNLKTYSKGLIEGIIHGMVMLGEDVHHVHELIIDNLPKDVDTDALPSVLKQNIIYMGRI